MIWRGRLCLFLLGVCVGYLSVCPLVRRVLIDIVVSGTGLFACQLAKNVFRAARVITTVSTGKVSKVHELLGEGVVDESESTQISMRYREKTISHQPSNRLQNHRPNNHHSQTIHRLHPRHNR